MIDPALRDPQPYTKKTTQHLSHLYIIKVYNQQSRHNWCAKMFRNMATESRSPN